MSSIFDGRKILVIDDELPVREVAIEAFMLMSDSLTVYEAVNGQEGLRLAKEHMPDAIFCDVMMPVMNGLTFVTQLRLIDRLRYVPLAVLTGFGNDSLLTEMLKVGADTFITKPASPMVMIAAAHALLRLRENYVDLQRKIEDLRGGVVSLESVLSNELGKERAFQLMDQAKVPIY